MDILKPAGKRGKGFKRSVRVEDLLQQEIADIILKDLNNAVMESCFVTVTDLKLTNDLKKARVYVSVLQEGAVRKTAIKELNRISGFIRHELGRRIRLKYIPQLLFCFDSSPEYADKIGRILNEVMDKDNEDS